jgi:hypothetical protein
MRGVRLSTRDDFYQRILKSVPQRLKPSLAHRSYGTTEAVPFVCRVFRSCRSTSISSCSVRGQQRTALLDEKPHAYVPEVKLLSPQLLYHAWFAKGN